MRKLDLGNLLRFDSIKKKLLFFMTTVGVCSVLAGSITTLYYSIQDARESSSRKIQTVMQIVGSMNEGALLFHDKDVASKTLEALQNEPEVVLACLYLPNNSLLASYIAGNAGMGSPRECPASPKNTHLSSYRQAYIYEHTIKDAGGELAGHMLLMAHLTSLQDVIDRMIFTTCWIVLLVSFITIIVSYVLQAIITKPIHSLAGLAHQISAEKDYSLRTEITSKDEIGTLASSINEMLFTIQERERELYEINEKAESANRSKSEFLANMSHEIRTPINGILGFAQLLSVMPLEEKQRSFVDIILSSGNSLLAIVNDILDFSKIEAGKLQIEAVPFEISKVIGDTVDMLQAKANEKSLEMTVRIAPGTPRTLIGDPTRVRQILINYVGNAIKFTDRGRITITAEARILGNTETIIRFEVTDTGIGISKTALTHIFDKFMQADASTTKRYGGTGLGLAICQQLSRLMGGDVGVESEESKGSCFWFEAPFRLDQTDIQVTELPDVDLSTCRMLIVDDHEMNRRILMELAESWKIHAQAAATGEEALDMLQSARLQGNPFHIAVLDHRLPNMDGEDLSNMIKTDITLADTSLVLLTSMGIRGDALKFQEIGFAAYLVKPARTEVLLNTISTIWLARQRGRKPLGILTRHSFAHIPERRAMETQGPDARSADPAEINHGSGSVPAIAGTVPKPVLPKKNKQVSLQERMKNLVHIAEEVADKSVRVVLTRANTRQLRPEKILLVEDQLTNRLVVENMLEEMNFPVYHAENGMEAVERMKEMKFSLILMDIHMPVMNGYDATQAIRRLETRENRTPTPIVAVTANAMEGDEQKCLAAGMDGYLAKPISMQALEEMVRRYLK